MSQFLKTGWIKTLAVFVLLSWYKTFKHLKLSSPVTLKHFLTFLRKLKILVCYQNKTSRIR